MIVLDIETSGVFPEKHGIWQIGALDFYNPKNTFLEECRIDEEDKIEIDASRVTEKTEAKLRDKNKQSQKDLLNNFFKWIESVKIKNAVCHNPPFDLGFITIKARKYGIKPSQIMNKLDINSPFHYRSFDLHSLAQSKYKEIYGKFLLEGDHSAMSLSKVLELCGMPHNSKTFDKLIAL